MIARYPPPFSPCLLAETMSSSARTITIVFHPRPFRSLITTTGRPRRSLATISTKNKEPTPSKEDSHRQAMPIGRFYEAILKTPRPDANVTAEKPSAGNLKPYKESPQRALPKDLAKKSRKATPPPTPAATPKGSPPVSSSPPPSIGTSAAVPTPPSKGSGAHERAKVIFGSQLAGPAERAERLAQIRSRSKMVAGVTVPPKPEEPDNCCMSGCVNCVWDRFRHDMEEWAAANAEAEKRLAIRASPEQGLTATRSPPSAPLGDGAALIVDDDGGGSEANWDPSPAPSPGNIAKDFWHDELYKNIPVGIREFMKHEKRLKAKHVRQGTSAT